MHFNRTLGSIFLVAGTAIGAGIIALPQQTNSFGLFPTLALMLVCWIFMTISAKFLMDAFLTLDQPNIDLATLAQYFLGPKGKFIAKLNFLLLLNALIAAYFCGIQECTGIHPLASATAIFVLLVAGTKYSDYANRLFMAVVLVSYFLFLKLGLNYFTTKNLAFYSLKNCWMALPIIILSFGFAIALPSLAKYLDYNRKNIYRALFGGSILTLLVYACWEIVFLGANIDPIDYNKNKEVIAEAFALSAIVTSLLGTSLGYCNFLQDTISLHKRWHYAALTIAIPVMFSIMYPKGFVSILNFAAVFVAILLGIIPALIAIKRKPSILPYVSLVFFAGIIGVEIFRMLCC